MSADLVYMLLRNRSSYIVKRDGVTLSSEPGNLTGKHSFTQSGLSNSRAVDVNIQGKGKKAAVVVSVKNGNSNSPSSFSVVGKNRGSASVAKATAGSYHRRDLTQMAQTRYNRLAKALSSKGVSKKSRRTRRK